MADVATVPNAGTVVDGAPNTWCGEPNVDAGAPNGFGESNIINIYFETFEISGMIWF